MKLQNKASISKWLAFLFFILVIVFIFYLTKNDGSFSAAWQDFTSIFT